MAYLLGVVQALKVILALRIAQLWVFCRVLRGMYTAEQEKFKSGEGYNASSEQLRTMHSVKLTQTG